MKFTLRFFSVTVIGLVLLSPFHSLWAQRPGTTTGGTAGGTSGGTTSGGTSGGTIGSPSGTTGGTTSGTTTGLPSIAPQTTPTPTQPTTTNAQPPPIYLSGIVEVDDGSPLPVGVNIQSICGSRQRIVANVSATGIFGFQWGNSNNGSVFQDASEDSGIAGFPGSTSGSGSGNGGSSGSRMDPLANCELRAEVAGYSSSRVNLYNHSAFDSSDIGTIVLHRMTGEEGRQISILSLKAPKDAKKNFDKGTQQVRANKQADAAASFRKAVASYPQYADAWLSLGLVELRTGAREDARADFRKAMDLDNKLVGPWQELGYIASDEGKWEDAARFLDQAVRLDPTDSPMAWYFSAMANYNLGKLAVAETSLRAEMKLDHGRNPREQYLLGMILIARKDLPGGEAALRNYIASSPNAPDAETARRQLSRAESLAGK